MLGYIARSHLSILAGAIDLPLGAGICAATDGNGISDVLSPTPDETLSLFTRNFWADQPAAIAIVFGVIVVRTTGKSGAGTMPAGGAVFGFALPALERREAWTN